MIALRLLFLIISAFLVCGAQYTNTTSVGLQTALTNAAIVAGDTIWLRGGTYVAPYTNSQSQNGLAWRITTSGATNNPITVRGYPGESVKLDRQWFLTTSKHRKFLDLEFYDSQKGTHGGNPQSFIDDANSTPSGNEWVNCIFHDTNMGLSGWSGGKSIRGCVFWYVGQTLAEHCVYPNSENFTGNISAWTAGSTVQLGSTNMVIRDNIAFGSGVSVAGSGPEFLIVYGANFSNNVVFDKSDYNIQGLYHNGGTVNIGGNRIIGRSPVVLASSSVSMFGNQLYMSEPSAAYALVKSLTPPGDWMIDFNNYYSANTGRFEITNGNQTFTQWKVAYSFDGNSTSADTTLPPDEVFVYVNADQAKRAHIAVINWTQADNVNVNLSSVLSGGDYYRLFNAQNYQAGPIKAGVFGGNIITVPMTNLTSAPVLYGTNAQPSVTSPEFAAFVLIGGGNYLASITVTNLIIGP